VRTGYPFSKKLVSRTLSTKSARQGPGIVPEVAQMFCPQRAQVAAREGNDQKEFVQTAEGHQNFPDD
jgi:hypothetical protein